jgi:ABC-2 type transport system permease protein
VSTLSYAAADSATMLRRNLRHALRYPSMTLSTAGMPVVFLLLFNYVFGGTLGAGLRDAAGAGGPYIDYLAPGLLVMTAAAGAVSTAVSVNVDMTEGIVSRFRTMAISRGSLLTGHVLGSMIQTLLSMALVAAIAVLAGFRPDGGPARWAAAAGLLALLTFALTWLAVALGMVSSSPETASNLPLPLTFLPFIGSGFVPTDSMPAGLQWFAEHQPFTPVIDTVRTLLMGGPLGETAVIAVAWCLVLALAGYAAARLLFERSARR